MDIIFEFFCAIGPYVVFTAGLIGTMVYNSSWSNSAKKRPNNFGNYILSLLTFAAFTIGGGLLVMFATIAIPLAVVICICASLASGGK